MLQNSLNEIHHLQKEIRRCTEFRSADEDIELESEADFYARAPPYITKPVGVCNSHTRTLAQDITANNEHERRLARLNWELHERKEYVPILLFAFHCSQFVRHIISANQRS
jgi:hypothetical protein